MASGPLLQSVPSGNRNEWLGAFTHACTWRGGGALMGGDPRGTRPPHLNLSSPDPCAALSSCHVWPRGSQCSLPAPPPTSSCCILRRGFSGAGRSQWVSSSLQRSFGKGLVGEQETACSACHRSRGSSGLCRAHDRRLRPWQTSHSQLSDSRASLTPFGISSLGSALEAGWGVTPEKEPHRLTFASWLFSTWPPQAGVSPARQQPLLAVSGNRSPTSRRRREPYGLRGMTVTGGEEAWESGRVTGLRSHVGGDGGVSVVSAVEIPRMIHLVSFRPGAPWPAFLQTPPLLGSPPGFEPRIRLCADSSEPGACFGFCLSLSLSLSVSLSLSRCPSPAHALSKMNKIKKKNLKLCPKAGSGSTAFSLT